MSTGDEIFTVRMISKLKRNISVWLCVLVGKTRSMNLTRVSPWSAAAVLPFFPRGDVSDLDQPCLSISAGHKGVQAKLFILTSFQQNKPCALGASVPRGAPPHMYTHTKKMQPPQLASSCLSAGMTSAPGLVTRTTGHPREKGHSRAFKRCRHLFYHVLSQPGKWVAWPVVHIS